MSNTIQSSTVTAVTPAPVAATAASQSEQPGKAGAPALQVPHAVIQAPKETPAAPKFDPEQFHKQLQDVVKRLNEQMKDYKRDLGFAVDNRINTFIVTVRNTNTGEVIRQIPNEVVVNFAHSLEDLKGVLFNETT